MRVPFGRRRLVGVVLAHRRTSEVAPGKLRELIAVLDDAPVLDDQQLQLIRFAAGYYHHPVGEVVATALPALLRQGRAAIAATRLWSLTAEGRAQDLEALGQRAPRQAELLRLLSGTEVADDEISGAIRRQLRQLAERGWITGSERSGSPSGPSSQPEPGPPLSAEQAAAVAAIAGDGARSFLLRGVTGSGKTEVYLAAAAAEIAAGRRVLVIVPEIGLTPQLVSRCRRRLGQVIAVLHSGLTDADRLAQWQLARSGGARVVLGTRSAVFAPVPDLGLIVVDEEHDSSLKQQDGLRYSARDLALLRARDADCAIVLGSATPSLESIERVAEQRMVELRLPRRAGGAEPPRASLVDLCPGTVAGGLTASSLARLREHLEAGDQALLFMNRRGFAPTLLCEECRERLLCPRCDAGLTLHRGDGRVRCHHCGHDRQAPDRCPSCDAQRLVAVGAGTQRIEETLAEALPGVRIARVDRDATRRRGSLEETLAAAQRGEVDVLIGTQMLAKGHDLHGITLAVVLDADQGLAGLDPRAPERLAQLIVQVGGRAGRGERPGEVLIQTRDPEHPLLRTLVEHGYDRAIARIAEERRAAGWPPYRRMALIRAEAATAAAAEAALRQLRQLLQRTDLEVLGPAPAPLARRAGRHRAQLILIGSRPALQSSLDEVWRSALEAPAARRARLSLDVDPTELS